MSTDERFVGGTWFSVDDHDYALSKSLAVLTLSDDGVRVSVRYRAMTWLTGALARERGVPVPLDRWELWSAPWAEAPTVACSGRAFGVVAGTSGACRFTLRSGRQAMRLRARLHELGVPFEEVYPSRRFLLRRMHPGLDRLRAFPPLLGRRGRTSARSRSRADTARDALLGVLALAGSAWLAQEEGDALVAVPLVVLGLWFLMAACHDLVRSALHPRRASARGDAR
ncbi:hypothetical protein [Cellulomonas soli]|uniref:Uncharacterized protein n=1 Tax=Cellulomonas soli TaxID=931535 RepID=A0A512PEF3_9CELL|nr:hypothetical protein [Cellulomonas soli]NYI58941.1 hypothetical protein [Cellulomonas soli]GEP69566.1 hypothetical protein CSO01_22810 [Cellulomonas soli]